VGARAWEAGLGGASAHFIQTFKKMRFSAEIWAKICLKMRNFLKKSCKITAASIRGSAQ